MKMENKVLIALAVVVLLAVCLVNGCKGPTDNGGSGLSAPVGLTATATSQESITLTWTEVNGAAKYKIYRAVTSTGQYVDIGETEERSYVANGLVPAKTYYFKVSSVGTDGVEGPQSTGAQATTLGDNKPVVPAPVGLTATATSQESITLTWMAVSGAAKYRVYFSVTSTGQYRYIDETEERSYVVHDLVPAKTYYFKVSSVGTDGVEGPQSTYARAATLDENNTPVIPTDPGTDTEDVSVTGVSLNKTSLTLEVGQSERLTATVSPANATNKAVTWSTSDAGVAAVSNGTVTGVAAGTATITVKTVDGNKTAACAVTVTSSAVSVSGVSLSQTSITLQEGSTETLTATVSPANATNKAVTWSTSDAGVAAVSNGTVTGVAAGTATITVKTVDGNKTAACTVTVTSSAVSVSGVSLNQTSLTLQEGEGETLTATVSPANATNKAVTWSTSDAGVAAVSNGTVTGVAAGTATITVKTVDGNKTAACTVTVTSPGPITYKVGGKGPAGGWIFYDKGNDSGGWRYLEAAPAEKEFKEIWANGLDSSVGTRDEVGSGKANTQAIAAVLQQSGETIGAARSCTRLNINGYTDWFLPSKDELYWMYVNLKEEGIGGFSGDWYWSSSQLTSGPAWARRFNDGSQEAVFYYMRNTYSVRAVRAF